MGKRELRQSDLSKHSSTFGKRGKIQLLYKALAPIIRYCQKEDSTLTPEASWSGGLEGFNKEGRKTTALSRKEGKKNRGCCRLSIRNMKGEKRETDLSSVKRKRGGKLCQTSRRDLAPVMTGEGDPPATGQRFPILNGALRRRKAARPYMGGEVNTQGGRGKVAYYEDD